MHFGLNETQQQLQEVARRFLASLSPDEGAWTRIVAEQGWQCIPISEAQGGFGLGWMDLAVVQEELGRTLTPSPLLGCGLAAAAGWAVESLLAGAPVTVLLGPGLLGSGSLGSGPLGTGVRARQTSSGWRLSGTLSGLNPESEQVLVEADGQLFEVASRLEPLPVLDASRPLGRVLLDETPGTPVTADLARVKAVASVLIAAEAVGGASACLEQAVAYLKVRKQFNQPIGSFQALQHMAADMLVGLESARSATWYACWALDAGSPDALLAAHTAKALATDAFFHCAGQNIQLHGGIGFTWEHTAHLYFKRALGSRSLFGLPREHREAVALALLGPA